MNTIVRSSQRALLPCQQYTLMGPILNQNHRNFSLFGRFFGGDKKDESKEIKDESS